MKINKKISKYNRTVYKNRSIKYIVIHYVGAVSTAKNNADYFAKGNRNSSAHYFCDATSIWQSVEDKNAAWHCGGGRQGSGGGLYFGIAKNANTIGIELCCIKKYGEVIVDPKAIQTAAPLVQYLMKKYGIPAKNVIRHYDVTGKKCPAGYLTSSTWKSLHGILTGTSTTSSKNDSQSYETIDCKDFIVKVKADSLNVRKGPGTGYPIIGCITDKGSYTIVKTNKAGTWGLLKKGPVEGSSWISIHKSYVTKK